VSPQGFDSERREVHHAPAAFIFGSTNLKLPAHALRGCIRVHEERRVIERLRIKLLLNH
jgi:hypothetical protein